MNDKEFNELRNQVEMLFGFLIGKKIITPEEVAFIINESRTGLSDILWKEIKDKIDGK